jgi:hypothetical protein
VVVAVEYQKLLTLLLFGLEMSKATVGQEFQDSPCCPERQEGTSNPREDLTGSDSLLSADLDRNGNYGSLSPHWRP